VARRFQLRFAFRLALFRFHYVFANIAFGRKRPPVNYAKCFFVLIFRQSGPSIVNVACSLSRRFCLAIVAGGYQVVRSRRVRDEYSCQKLQAAVKWKPRDKEILRTPDALPDTEILQIKK
jgi:hypothetical protein